MERLVDFIKDNEEEDSDGEVRRVIVTWVTARVWLDGTEWDGWGQALLVTTQCACPRE